MTNTAKTTINFEGQNYYFDVELTDEQIARYIASRKAQHQTEETHRLAAARD